MSPEAHRSYTRKALLSTHSARVAAASLIERRSEFMIKDVPWIPDKRFFLCAAGALGGAINAVAGGGSFVAFPALLFTGVPAVAANATNTLSLWVGVTASGGAYWKR